MTDETKVDPWTSGHVARSHREHRYRGIRRAPGPVARAGAWIRAVDPVAAVPAGVLALVAGSWALTALVLPDPDDALSAPPGIERTGPYPTPTPTPGRPGGAEPGRQDEPSRRGPATATQMPEVMPAPIDTTTDPPASSTSPPPSSPPPVIVIGGDEPVDVDPPDLPPPPDDAPDDQDDDEPNSCPPPSQNNGREP